MNPDVRANYLASPPLVVAYALAGSMQIDLTTASLGDGKDGKPVYLKDIWPTSEDSRRPCSASHVTNKMFATRYGDVFKGDKSWQGIKVAGGQTYAWDIDLDLREEPALLRGHVDGAVGGDGHHRSPHPVGLRRLDHHRPHQRLPVRSRPRRPAGVYLRDRQVPTSETSTATAPAAATTK